MKPSIVKGRGELVCRREPVVIRNRRQAEDPAHHCGTDLGNIRIGTLAERALGIRRPTALRDHMTREMIRLEHR